MSSLKEESLISVIVPIHNTEKYLPRCLESIARQSYETIEVILVIDHSSEESVQICNIFCNKDHRFRIAFAVDKGASSARNLGLEEAKGDWIYFIDSDDFIHPKAISILFQAVSLGYDMAECLFLTHPTDKPDPFNSIEYSYSVLPEMQPLDYRTRLFDFFSNRLERTLPATVVWNKLYSKKIIESLSFRNTVLFEDAFWNYMVIKRAPRMISVHAVLYAYCQRSDSLVRSAKPKDYVSELETLIAILNDLDEKDCEIRAAALTRVYRKMLSTRFHVRKTPEKSVFFDLTKDVFSNTFKEYVFSDFIPFLEKVMFLFFWPLPPIHYAFMKIMGN
jgi:glycosyltransferase involved in cell wall biosynthesis